MKAFPVSGVDSSYALQQNFNNNDVLLQLETRCRCNYGGAVAGSDKKNHKAEKGGLYFGTDLVPKGGPGEDQKFKKRDKEKKKEFFPPPGPTGEGMGFFL